MNIEYAVKVEKGRKTTNDDRVLIDGVIHDECIEDGIVSAPAVAVLCDGCGGVDGGDIAAETTLNVILEEEAKELADKDYLLKVLQDCQDAVRLKQNKMPDYSKMCTTIAGCIFAEDSIVLFHSGDSRIYRCNKWGVVQMTKDHSKVQGMVDRGEITVDEAKNHPQKNVINRCIGRDFGLPDIYVSSVPLRNGEKYVICSDGLWESLENEDFDELLKSDMTLKQISDELVKRALSNGASDNISVCICLRKEE